MPESEFGSRLFEIVPRVYRNRDALAHGGNGDFEKYLAGAGQLLDELHALIRQFQADNFPDNPIDGSLPCQDWLIPYFADLLDVQLVSPLSQGQRDEVANAVKWRKTKGTLGVIESIAEAVGQWEVVIQEAWKRVATTPRIDAPLLPSQALGYTGLWQEKPPSMASRHPGLPALTVDFRCPSTAVAASSGDAGAQYSTVDGDERIWRQGGYHGVPCHPGGFDDTSPRSVDFRSGNWQKGHFHPGKLLLFIVPPAGWFRPALVRVDWRAVPSQAFNENIEIIEEPRLTRFRNRSLDSGEFKPVRVRRRITLSQAGITPGSADGHQWVFEGLILENDVEVESGRVGFDRCAVRGVISQSMDDENPVITAKDVLFESVEAPGGLVQLEYCTVLKETVVKGIRASDCIFNDRLHQGGVLAAPPEKGCLRFCAVLPGQQIGTGMKVFRLSHEAAVFFTDRYGDRSCGVLHPACSSSIKTGAEDGTEMGAFHLFRLGMLAGAVRTKLQDFVPLGLEVVVVQDPSLMDMPG